MPVAHEGRAARELGPPVSEFVRVHHQATQRMPRPMHLRMARRRADVFDRSGNVLQPIIVQLDLETAHAMRGKQIKPPTKVNNPTIEDALRTLVDDVLEPNSIAFA